MNRVSFTYQSLDTDLMRILLPMGLTFLSLIAGCLVGMIIMQETKRTVFRVLGGLLFAAGVAGAFSFIFLLPLTNDHDDRVTTAGSLKAGIEQTMDATYVGDPEDLTRYLSRGPRPLVLEIDGTPTNCTFTLTSKDTDPNTPEGQATGTVACTGVAVLTQ